MNVIDREAYLKMCNLKLRKDGFDEIQAYMIMSRIKKTNASVEDIFAMIREDISLGKDIVTVYLNINIYLDSLENQISDNNINREK